MNKSTTKSVNCPTCQKAVQWSEDNEFRPFCSQRCQLIDFGDWATEKHSIAGEPFYPVDKDEEEPLQ
ncbi:MAG: DNA gyrase inhibitor YacG [Pseudomonadales bacterium]|nr:DNA gyrase inhibitor YacG [Pseudomonadales bacterium]